MTLRWMTCLIVLLFSTGVTGVTGVMTVAAATPEAKPADVVKTDKVVCKKVKVTGSHFRKRVCQKQSAWKRMEREAQRAMKTLEAPTTN